ncbi:MAG TPA: LD-carboxypeptidase [Thermoanaerobaculia bacterium]|nr:LD-carboxypeptidase [Thermoanaerobaculia bacterium]
MILHLPPATGPGDRVGVAALSGPVRPERLEAGIEALHRLGFEPVLADNLLSRSRHGLFAGDDAERLAAFHELAADPDLRAIFFARGGSGLLRILPAIDWELLRRHPRAYVGYSDLTPFLLEIVRRLGLVTFHGPLVAAELAAGLTVDEETSLFDALAGRYPLSLPFKSWLRPPAGRDVKGPLLGGCLSLLSATTGTPYFPDLDGAILFWEEINEHPYRVDRMLTHLRLSDNLTRIAGMIVGHLEGGTGASGADWPAFVADSLSGLDFPVAWGLESGHLRPNWTLPLGMPARLGRLDDLGRLDRLDNQECRLWLGEGMSSA